MGMITAGAASWLEQRGATQAAAANFERTVFLAEMTPWTQALVRI